MTPCDRPGPETGDGYSIGSDWEHSSPLPVVPPDQDLARQRPGSNPMSNCLPMPDHSRVVATGRLEATVAVTLPGADRRTGGAFRRPARSARGSDEARCAFFGLQAVLDGRSANPETGT